MPSFFSPEDLAARRRSLTGNQQPTREDIEAYSLQKAREVLDGVLAAIRESHNRGGHAHSFSYDIVPFAGSRTTVDHLYDCQVMVTELARLVRERTGLTCTLDPGNGPNKSSFTVKF